MDYHILKKYRYTNRNQFESIYSSRYKNELALHYELKFFQNFLVNYIFELIHKDAYFFL